MFHLRIKFKNEGLGVLYLLVKLIRVRFCGQALGKDIVDEYCCKQK